MSTAGIRQARAALQADPTKAQSWVDYIQALIDGGQADEAHKMIALGRSKGLSDVVLEDLVRLHATAGANPGAPTQTLPPAAGASALPPPEEVHELAAMFQAQRLAELEPLARRMTVRFPSFAFGWAVLGAALTRQGCDAEALGPSMQAALLAPDDASAHNNLGGVLNSLGQFEDALVSLRRALELQPESLETHLNLGKTLHALGRLEEACSSYQRVMQIKPDFIPAYGALGNLLAELGRPDEAQPLYEHALALDPSDAVARLGLGSALFSQGQLDDAERHFRLAVELDPENADAHFNHGIALKNQLRREDAATSFMAVVRLCPDHHDALFNLALVLRSLGRYAEAEQAYREDLRYLPDSVQARALLAETLEIQGRLDEAESTYRQALQLQPNDASLTGSLLFSQNYHADKSAEDIYQAYAAYERQFGAPLGAQWPVHANADTKHRRLRIGYVSPDLRKHPVGYFLEPLLACHDHSRFEIFAYAELSSEDDATARYRSYCDHFILTRGMPDEALAARIRADGIDVLVDTAGHTTGNRLLVFARKPAPVSLSWMGYGYTTGLKAIDYFLVDEASAPVGSEHLFAETPWRLPCAYVYRPDPTMGQVSTLPARARGFVTFGTLSRAIRINHHTIRVWSQILKRLPGSVLVIDSRNFQHVSMQADMAERFAEHGIAPEQLQIGCHSPPWDTLRAMDIALDCFPHNSGTTLFESLYMGVPFITLAGRPSVGRLGRTVLTGLGKKDWLDAWCADSEEDYIDKAVALASDLPALARIRDALRPTMQRSALMDEVGFTRNVEQAYAQMVELWQATQARESRL